MDRGFVQGLYESFDEQYRGDIQAIVEKTFCIVGLVTAPDQLPKCRSALSDFQRDIVRYSIELADVPEGGAIIEGRSWEAEDTVKMHTTGSAL
jgi:hypothetical protein